jgi:hypothetical protein
LAGGTLTGNLNTSGSGNYILIGGSPSGNGYNTVPATTGLMFGGANDPNNYSIGTSTQNIGGNYTKLNIKWHTGIRFFSMPQYGGTRFYSDAAMGTETFSINNSDSNVRVSNSLYANDVRASIFYDSSNTGYYVDPASTSVLNDLGVGISPASKLHVHGTQSYGSLRISPSSTNGESAMAFYSDTSGVQTSNAWVVGHAGWGNTGDFVIGNQAGGGPLILVQQNGYTGIGNTAPTEKLTVTGNILSTISVRSSSFYDNDNTGFYFDGSSPVTSVRISGDVLIDQQYGKGVVGVYSATVLQHVWSMGAAYRIAANGSSTGNMYGLAWSHPNAGSLGGANHLNDHGLLLINNGSFRAAISSRAVFSADVRGTLFYDYNDTGYYVDANSESRLSTLRTGSHLCLGGFTNAAPSNVSTTGRITFGSLTTDAISNYSIGTNLENYGGTYNKLDLAFHTGIRLGAHPNYGGVRFYADQTMGTEVFAVGKSGDFVQAANSMRAPIFYDSANTGYYVDPSANSSFLGSTYGGLSIGETPVNYDGWDRQLTLNGSGHARIHVKTASRRMGIYAHDTWHNGGGGYVGTYSNHSVTFIQNAGSAGYIDTSKNLIWQGSSVRAPVFYDSNNTGYYVDSNALTNLYNLNLTGAKHTYLYINPGNNYEAMVRYNGGTGSGWYVGKRVSSDLVGTDNFHAFSEAAGRTVFGIDTSGVSISYGSSRAPIFYDNNDTGYYVDPHNISAFRRLTLASSATTTFATPNVMSYASSNTAGAAQYHIRFVANNGNSNGNISTNYYQTTYATTSDYRVKEDFQPMVNATSRLMSLNPVNFQWKDSDIRTDGFLAHEVAEVVSDAVVGEKDAVDEKGNDELQALDQSKLVPLLVKTIQELEARITALENA